VVKKWGDRQGMFKRLRKNLAESNYGPLTFELVVVILGILIAFQIDRWAEDRRDREQEYDYLVRLKDDLLIEIQSIDRAVEYAESRIAAVLLLEEVIENPSITATWRSFPQIDAFVYSELQSTGNLALIRSETLRRDLANHYSTLRHHERVGFDLDIQHQFDRLSAGIISTAELRSIEEGSWSNTTSNISSERGLQIAEEFARRQDAIDLLPNIAQHHVFNEKVMELARGRTLEMIERIELLIEDIEH
jgi:hypothetical protein